MCIWRETTHNLAILDTFQVGILVSFLLDQKDLFSYLKKQTKKNYIIKYIEEKKIFTILKTFPQIECFINWKFTSELIYHHSCLRHNPFERYSHFSAEDLLF